MSYLLNNLLKKIEEYMTRTRPSQVHFIDVIGGQQSEQVKKQLEHLDSVNRVVIEVNGKRSVIYKDDIVFIDDIHEYV